MRHPSGRRLATAHSFPLLPPVSGHGFVGYSSQLLGSNAMPDYTPGENFFTVFGVFFPAATGDPPPAHLCSCIDKVNIMFVFAV